MRSTYHRFSVVSLVLILIPSVVAAQPGTGFERPTLSSQVQLIGAFTSTLLVGALLLVAAPGDVERITDQIHDEGVQCLGWGILVGAVGLFILGLLLVSAIVIGLPPVVGFIIIGPVAIGLIIIALLGHALGYLALFDHRVESPWTALVLGGTIAATIAGVANVVPVVGLFVGLVIETLGTGAIVRHWRE